MTESLDVIGLLHIEVLFNYTIITNQGLITSPVV